MAAASARSTSESAPRVARVGVGEVLADVAEPGRAEQGVGHGVGHHVGVAVALEAPLALEAHAAEHECVEPGRR